MASRCRFRSPGDAIKAGVGMVHQHFMLVPVFTVAENVTLGVERTRVLGLLDRRRARRDVRELSERYGLDVNPDAYVENLPVGTQQRVEIVKALLREASVLILDEPTSVLTPGETEDLFRVIRELKAGGRSIVFISHKLKEVQAIADTITVIRRGRVVGERPPTATDAELATLMVGLPVELKVSKGPARPGETVLDVRGLTATDDHGQAALDDVSFQVKAGEILGVAGVQGNGQTELCEALIGLRPAAAGSVLARRQGPDACPAQGPAPGGHRLRAGRPAGRRPGPGVLGGGEPGPGRLRPAAVRLGRRAQPGRDQRQREDPGRRVRRQDHIHAAAGRHALRRQPAESHPGPGDEPGRAAAARQPAHPRPRRRLR